MILLGMIVLLGMQDPVSMREQHGDQVVTLWALARFSAGVLGLVGAVGATVSLLRRGDPTRHLWVEFAACCLIALAQGFYEVGLAARFGVTSTLETQTLTAAFAIAGAARALTIPGQIRRWKRARAGAQTTPALADPHRTTE